MRALFRSSIGVGVDDGDFGVVDECVGNIL